MLTGAYWPAHPHPLPGEVLSCWIVRIAHANGLKVQTFCDNEFGKSFQIWNRDIDRNAPDWLLRILSQKTGTAIKQARHTTAALYEQRLFPVLHPASQLRWLMPVKKYHRLHKGFALQYCPECLKEDDIPYFRLSWRLALYTFCPRHRILMADRCHNCEASVAFHRLELGKADLAEVKTLDCCWQCGEPLSEAMMEGLSLHPKLVDAKWSALLKSIDRQFYPAGALNFQSLSLLHQLCRLLSSGKYHPKLAAYICWKGEYVYPALSQASMIFEQRNIAERHALLQLAWWLMTHRNKLQVAIQKQVVRVNHLYRDLDADAKSYVLDTVMRRRVNSNLY